ncbi:MAG: mechanosensitive ion channel, partial [Bacteroidia bacterium]|nr:mechanosensitive ion channel [Bacteroidia bacterium]
MREILSTIIFNLAGQNITLGQVILVILIISAISYSYVFILKKFFRFENQEEHVSVKDRKNLRTGLLWTFLVLFILLVILTLKLDFSFYTGDSFDLKFSLILKVILLVQLARLLDLVITSIIVKNYILRRSNDKSGSSIFSKTTEDSLGKTISFLFYTLVTLFILQNFNLDFTLFERNINDVQVSFKVSNILHAVLIILFARIIIWISIHVVLYNIYKNKGIDVGSQFAFNQLVKYVIYVFAILMALDAIGINMTLLLGGAAALLVGIGLGLQQTFNDFISGIVLLFERSVSVGDVLEFEGTVGTIKEIGLRSSIVETRENISLIVPNHLLVNNKVINWTHYSDKVRFEINIGVAYGSDAALVKKILLDIADQNPYVLQYPSPIVRLKQFGESSLDFT